MTLDTVFGGVVAVAVVSTIGFLVLLARSVDLRRQRDNALASAAQSAQDRALLFRENEQTRRLVSMISEQVEARDRLQKDFDLVAAATENAVTAARQTAEATIQQMTAFVEKWTGHRDTSVRLENVMRQEIFFLRAALRSDRSHERASQNLEAERLVRESDVSEAALAPPILGPQQFGYQGAGPSFDRTGPPPKGAHRFASVRRDRSDQGDEADAPREVPEPATVAGPVPTDG